ncbi:hypothetical protein A9Q68_07945 [Streptococcus bovimastitidis]|uniref:DUF1700 domain-containing protein n=1 Tax=Streptococcus bovimastitidis TaxID=1856638 RepID=A0A1L8MM98_9STRE|nr:DUF1700 domain-containing protein [Streptococcus bovimastitidis]OJF71900.1 hypothetical protein A9Q68_07945 [Streptococcus bovimastitidis]
MTRTEYLAELQNQLRKLPQDDFQEAMDYFTEYFDEAGPENEAQVITDLGSPKEAASEILGRLLEDKIEIEDKKPKHYAKIIWLTILSILAAPAALPILFAIIALVLALLFAIGAIIFSLIILGVSFFANGCYVLFDSFSYLATSINSTILSFGMGLIMIGGSLLAIYLGVEACAALIRGGAVLIQKLLKRGQTA